MTWWMFLILYFLLYFLIAGATVPRLARYIYTPGAKYPNMPHLTRKEPSVILAISFAVFWPIVVVVWAAIALVGFYTRFIFRWEQREEGEEP